MKTIKSILIAATLICVTVVPAVSAQQGAQPAQQHQWRVAKGDSVMIKRECQEYLTGETPSVWVWDKVHTVFQLGTKRFPEGVLLMNIYSWICEDCLIPVGQKEEQPEEPKAEEPKQKVPAQEVTPVVEPKKEEPKQVEPKQEVPAQEVTPVTKPKKEDSKKKKQRKDEPKKEEPKQVEPKQEVPAQEVTPIEEPKKETPKKEEPKKEEPKQVEPKKEEPKQEVPAQEVTPLEEPKKETPKKEEPKKEEPKQVEPKQEVPAQEVTPVEEPKKEESKLEEPVQEEIPLEEPQQPDQQPVEQPVVDGIKHEPAKGDSIKSQQNFKHSYDRFTIGLRGGAASLLHKADNGNWTCGADVMLDLQYAHYWAKDGRPVDLGIITGLSIGYSQSSLKAAVNSSKKYGDPEALNPAVDSVQYTVRADEVKEHDGQLQLEIPVMFSLIHDNGLYFNIGPKFMLPVFTPWKQTISDNSNTYIQAYFEETGVLVKNEDITGKLKETDFVTKGTDYNNMFTINIMLMAEIGYEWTLKNGNSLGLGAYANYSVYNSFKNNNTNADPLVSVQPPVGTTDAILTVNPATKTYANGLGFFDAGVKVAYHFNFPKKPHFKADQLEKKAE